MKRLKEWMGKIKNNRKFRCGGFSALLTAAVIAVALLLGALADGIEERFALQGDYSFNAATSQGEVTRAVLAQLDKDVRIYAVAPDGGGDETLFSLLDRYAAASPHILVSRENLLRNPVLQTRFSGGIGEKQVTEECLIIYCPETDRTRILTEDDYTVKAWDTETWQYVKVQYAHEKAVTEAILLVIQEDTPEIQILTGHGEMTADDTSLMITTLKEVNYTVRWVNLAAGDALDPQSTLMILSPGADLAAWEVEKLMEFAGAGGDFFVCSRYVDPLDLSNYAAFLRSFGVEPYPGLVIAKPEDTASYYGAPVILLPYMQETPMTLPLIEAGQNLMLMSASRAFHLDRTIPADVTLTPLLMTGQAYIRNIDDGAVTADQQPGDEEGVFAVGLWSEKLLETEQTSKMYVTGDMSAFLNPQMEMGVSTSANAYLIQILRSLQDQTAVNLDILPRSVNRPGMTPGDVTPGLIVIIMLPLLAALGAALVLWPRRNL